MNFIKNNFKLKLLVPVIAIYLLAGVAIYKVAITAIKTTLASEFTSKGKTIINTLSSSIQETILDRDPSTVQGFIDQYRNVEGISFILILDEKNKILAHTFYPKVPDQYFKMANDKIDQKRDREGRIIIEEQTLNNHRELVLSRPILNGLLGHIYVGMGIETREKEVIAPLTQKMILIIFAFILIASFLIIIILNLILMPIFELTKTAELFAHSEINNVNLPVIANDEIGKLTMAFNKMVGKITEHTKELEDEVKERTTIIKEQQASLIYTSKMAALGEMAGGIAHEINNPLTIISGTSAFLKRLAGLNKLDTKVTIKSLNEIESTVFRIAKIIQGLKTVSRDSSNEEFSIIKLRDLMEDITGLCSEKFKNDGIHFIFNLNDPVYDNMIECRRVQISQVFINLLGNAYDAIEDLPERWIKLECKLVNDIIVFYICDSGNGIPKEIQDKIFQPFFTTKEIGKGTGLGLSLSQNIVKAHKGILFLDEESPNTCFIIKLPCSQKATRENNK